MQTPFIEPGETNNAQLFFITFIYAYVLYQASDLISGGSELLMLVPAVAGLVGSIVLPILGAVPDGMMVLFSGIGPNAQETVAVGVGALAGSTVMLLTFPWFICIVFGRVPLKDGKADYANKGKAPLMGSGITFGPSIKTSAKIMLGTTLLYLVMQIPASLLEFRGDDTKEQARGEHTAALVGLVCCVLAFCGYLVYCYFDANEDKQLAAVVEGIEKKQISIAAALQFIQKTSGSQHELLSKDRGRLKKVCKPFFKRYDFDKDATLTKDELKPLLHDLGYWPDSNNMGKIMGATNGGYAASRLNASMDKDGDGKINFDEFVDYLYNFMCDDTKMALAPSFHNPKYIKYDEEDEDEEEAPRRPKTKRRRAPGQGGGEGKPRVKEQKWWDGCSWVEFERRWRRREALEAKLRAKYLGFVQGKYQHRQLRQQIFAAERSCEHLDRLKDIGESELWPPEFREEFPNKEALQVPAFEGATTAWDEVLERNELESPEYCASRVVDLLTHLRIVHLYCLHCGCHFADAEDLDRSCPGVEEEAHEAAANLAMAREAPEGVTRELAPPPKRAKGPAPKQARGSEDDDDGDGAFAALLAARGFGRATRGAAGRGRGGGGGGRQVAPVSAGHDASVASARRAAIGFPLRPQGQRAATG
mmetsp:Transcript_104564/g.300612  ORF Transcript_104564/g.300612 Transcript_104564/m.300612 type:complete len:647 (-) Transcript_104564:73-2013(-)